MKRMNIAASEEREKSKAERKEVKVARDEKGKAM